MFRLVVLLYFDLCIIIGLNRFHVILDLSMCNVVSREIEGPT